MFFSTGKGEDQYLTYGELDRRASRLAAGLAARGVKPEELVGLSVERSPELIIGLLGILKAGAAYLPLDPDYPTDRLAYMIGDSGTRLILVDGSPSEGLPAEALLHLGNLCSASARLGSPPSIDLDPELLAYTIYTSGSTGRPKGALIPHRALVNLVASNAVTLGLGPGQRVLQFSPLNFDASIFEIIMALGSGATLCLARREEVLPGPDLVRLLHRARVTHLTVPPSVLAALPPAELPDLRVLCCAGEALPPRLVDRWAPGRRLFNLYGPTEATIWTTFAECRSGAGTPSLGRPIPKVKTHLVDCGLRAVERHANGEMAIGGIGVARGYLERPGMSAERFVPDPWAERPGDRLYRSGDLARDRGDGNLEFVGRIDFQVKIRGNRIELGEIESALCKHSEIDSAAVLATSEAPPRLVAFVLPGSQPGPSQAELGRFLRGFLPDYMLPGSYCSLSELPRTPNGKVDRDRLGRELLASAAAENRGPEPRSVPVNRPATSTEKILAQIWRELLGLEEIDRGDDFFALGGQSLLVGRLIARAREALAVELPLRAFFEAPTLAEMARRIDDGTLSEPAGPSDPARPAVVVAPTRPAFEPPPRSGPIPLSFPQERIWFFEQLAPGNLAYNAQATISLVGDLDPERLRRALTEIVRRHEILRTIFVTQDGRPIQVISDPFAVELPLVDLAEIADERQAVAAEAIARDTFSRPFDTTRLPLARWRLVRLARREHVLVHLEHHFVHDGWSFGVLLGELEALYEGLSEGREPGAILPPVSAQFADFALWQRDWLRGPVLRRYLDHWRRQLEGMPPSLDLPTDRPRAEAQTFVGDAHRIELPARFCGELRALTRGEGTTLFNVMLAGFAALIHRYSGATDFGVGSAIANRQLKPLEGMLGMVVNTMVLRCVLGGGSSFSEVLGRLRETTLEAQAYQDIPFDKLVEELQPERDPSRNPLFQVMFSFHDSPVPDVDFGGLTGKVQERHNGSAKNDLNIIVIPRAEQRIGRERRAGDEAITLIWEFNTDLFDRTTAGRMLRQYQVLLSSAAAAAGRRIDDLTLLTPGEHHQLLNAWNDTVIPPVAARTTLHGRFEIQARSTPGAVAVIADGERWSYRQLNQRANRLAHLLRRQGMARGDLVGIFLPRSFDMITAVVAVLKAGGAYVPLEESWPANRVRGILERTPITRLLTHREPFARLSAGTGDEAEQLACEQAICLDVEDLSVAPTENLRATTGADDLAYLIFTSGSTGVPKGVMEQHRPAVGLIDWVNQRFGVGPGDRLLFVTALAFDLSVYDIFGTLAAGGSIRVASAAETRDPERLVEILCHEPITFWDSAPPTLQRMVTYLPAPGELSEAPALRRVFLSGDWIPLPLPDQIRKTFPGAEVIALGGATEATIWSNFFPVGRVAPEWPSIPYGRPIDNARYHTLDERLRPCPIGIRGDLFIGGRCLSLGYALAPQLTAERYLPDPFSGPGDRLYRTGDRTRYLVDGNLQFLGRLDNQVKLRGFRVELGEIEAALGSHDGVREGVVLVRGSAEQQRLVAFYIASGTDMPVPEELRSYLRHKLPEYMIPATYETVSSWPLTPTGKLDRRALLQLGPQARGVSRAAVAGALGTGGSLYETVTRIWAEKLELDPSKPIDLDTTFFDLGGNSLLMPGIHSLLREELGVDFGLVELFRNPTLRSLVGFLEHTMIEGRGFEGVPLGRSAAAAVRVGADAANQRPIGTALAVIGFAGRFPGARDTSELWRNLCAGREAVRTLSDDELLAAGVPAAALANPDYVKRRAPLENPGHFDAAFFGLTPREAEILDPQQRVFLQCVWHALEHAGYCPDGLEPRVGIFAGSGENTYGERLKADQRLVEAVGRTQIAIANNPDYLATRVSYELDLKGPSLSVQTACSTSLVAVHMARLSLLHGDCELAVAGGVSVRAQETAGYVYLPGGIGSPDGRVRTFDAQARGTVGGSGAGCVVLKRLDDARADGDTIHAVLRGTAINNDGALKMGFTAPSVAGQTAAIRDAHQVAGVAPETIGYVEAHGTATTLGDPIEFRALSEAFSGAKAEGAKAEGETTEGETTEGETSCGLGSIKSNLGHLDVAAGAAGLIKTVLTLKHGLIPPSLHFEQPNP
ncbi:MAG: amino acid adenylation domain-containing protein, partial [Acidobacteriota bacterium]